MNTATCHMSTMLAIHCLYPAIQHLYLPTQ